MTVADWLVVGAMLLLAYALRREWNESGPLEVRAVRVELGTDAVILECDFESIAFGVVSKLALSRIDIGRPLWIDDHSMAGHTKYRITNVERLVERGPDAFKITVDSTPL